jgi:putative nucleotidyltransferase with HDIG domain
MEKLNFPKRFRVYLPLIGLFLLLVLMMPRSPKFNYDYKKGSPWMYETLMAQFDFPVLKTDQQIMEERETAEAEMVPYFKLDSRVAYDAEIKVAAAKLGRHSYARKDISDAVTYIYSKGVFLSGKGQDALIPVLDQNGLIYVQIGKRASKVPASEVFTLEQAEGIFRSAVATACQVSIPDSLMSASGLDGVIVPDLLFDSETTERAHEENVENISRTQGIVRSGQLLVSEGDIVTAETEQLLNSYKAEYESNVSYSGPGIFQWGGNVLLAFSLVLVLFLAIFYCNARIFEQYNKYLYLLMIFAISSLACSLVSRTDPSLLYMVPFTLVSLYLLAFFKKRVVFTVYIISLLPLLIFSSSGMELFMMYLIAGVVGIQVFGYFNRGWLQFVTAFIVFLVMVLVWVAFRLIDDPNGLSSYHVIWKMALAAFMSVAGYPLVYLFEKIFSLVSNSKLIELSDTSNKLLRQLADKAPGTFQHSLQVMNLADAAARSIDANVLLVRAGALYHDIGKTLNPQCFTENEAGGVRYHDGLTPKESAQEIIKHVSDGLALADKHGLPGEVADFIRTHHGTTSTGYFLTKYLNDGGDPDDVSAFCYDGVKPVTKEQVILMICDAVEAASRSLKNYSAESISELVERIVGGKIAEGQLAEAHISLNQINIIKAEIKTYLQQMYHSRIAYPKRQENTSK